MFYVNSCITKVPFQTVPIGELRSLLGTLVVNPRREKQPWKSGHWHSAYVTCPSEPAPRQIIIKWLKK
jgi:hypothetical protein